MNILPIYKRELRSYFQSPGYYIFAALFLLLIGLFFVNSMILFSLLSSDGQLRQQFEVETMNLTERVIEDLFASMNFILIFLIPLLTMKLFAEEKKSGTYDILQSYPLTTSDILFGKYFAVLSVNCLIISLTIIYPILTSRYAEIEYPVVLSSYLGIILVSAAYCSLGIFASSITENQIIAAVLSFTGLLFFYVVSMLGVGRFGMIESICKNLSFVKHCENFTKGIIDISDIAYFLLFSIFFLFLSHLIIELQKRGLED